MPQIGSIICAQSKIDFGEFLVLQLLCKLLVVNLVCYGQNIKDRRPIKKRNNYFHVSLVVFQFQF